MKNIIKSYKKDFDYSYTSGASITIELLKKKPDLVESVFIHPDFRQPDTIATLCAKNGIDCIQDDIVFKRTNQKENSYVLGVFKKYPSVIEKNAPHVVLANPSDMGNLGTIIRTLAGFNIHNLAIITPAADIWNPKTIRASMGSRFHANFQHYKCIEEYLDEFPKHKIYTFMLDGAVDLRNIPIQKPFSLVFGNEATGLGENYRYIGTVVKIPQSTVVDSLNLSVAVAIGAFCFTTT